MQNTHERTTGAPLALPFQVTCRCIWCTRKDKRWQLGGVAWSKKWGDQSGKSSGDGRGKGFSSLPEGEISVRGKENVANSNKSKDGHFEINAEKGQASWFTAPYPCKFIGKASIWGTSSDESRMDTPPHGDDHGGGTKGRRSHGSLEWSTADWTKGLSKQVTIFKAPLVT